MSFVKGISGVIKSLLDLTRVVALETELSLNIAGGAVRGRHSLKALGLDGVGFLNLDVGNRDARRWPLPGRPLRLRCRDQRDVDLILQDGCPHCGAWA